MNKIICLSLIALLPLHDMLFGQSHYEVSRTHFSTKKYDEFCPVLLKDQIIFCSNQEYEMLLTYEDMNNKGLFNIFKVNIDPDSEDAGLQVFSQYLITPFNDGPAAFSPDGKTVVYSRNIDVKSKTKNIFDLGNNLGIYFAEEKDGEWKSIIEFPFNDPHYSITTPCYSHDGNYIYFASDMPGGIGGTDLYRSVLTDGTWGDPENLGTPINSKGNEVYPFVNSNGDLFFASDGHGGLGKKDVFLSRFNGVEWINPVHLDAPINSKEDDFGLITNGEFTEGYFSTNRDRSDDIFTFTTLIPQLFDCDTLLENIYCFEFWEDMYQDIDSLPVSYEWEFSDGTRLKGLRVEHCLPGAGSYWARLNMVDNTTANTFFTQTSMEFDLEDHVQPYIKSREAGIQKSIMEFSGSDSYLPGYDIQEYVWDFDDGTFKTGDEVAHQFKNPGLFGVKLGLTGMAEGSSILETRCVIKPVTILKDNQTLAMYLAGIEISILEDLQDRDGETININQDFSLFDINPEEEVFRVEVLASEEKIVLEDSIFDPLREHYEIKEFYLSGDNLYSYTVGEYNSLLATYGVYNDVVKKGFTSSKVKTYMLAELPSEVIEKINLDFAEFADANFEFSKSEVSENSYPILDRVATIMIEYPDLVMEIAAHTDNVGSFEFNMDLSQKRAESIMNYLIFKGVEDIRIMGKGYGEARPVATNSTEEGRMINRRVEFIILNE
ncbi:MAG: OmpA family protein [Bacteroidetes bacterium]|nr:OmpA family protein [Bacteroidota bacterium]